MGLFVATFSEWNVLFILWHFHTAGIQPSLQTYSLVRPTRNVRPLWWLWGCDTHCFRKKPAASILHLVDEVIVFVEAVPNINQTHFIEDRGIDIEYHEHELKLCPFNRIQTFVLSQNKNNNNNNNNNNATFHLP